MKNLLLVFLSTFLITSVSEARTRMQAKEDNPSATSAIKVLKDMKEYKQARNSRQPVIITFNAPECDYCKQMVPAFEKAINDYSITIYSLNAKDPAFANNEEFKNIKKQIKITGYPVTFFLNPGAKEKTERERIERGGMTDKEIDDFTYELAYGKPKPEPKKATKEVEKA